MHHFEDGKPCHTRFRKVGVGELLQPVGGETKYSVVEAELLTGRKHQIRAHLAELGFPILGDRTFGLKTARDPRLMTVNRQMLHAAELELPDPMRNLKEPLKAHSPLPADFRQCLRTFGI
jgi:23S rRNA-/tRNA-specific pseudouridylate synthase